MRDVTDVIDTVSLNGMEIEQEVTVRVKETEIRLSPSLCRPETLALLGFAIHSIQELFYLILGLAIHSIQNLFHLVVGFAIDPLQNMLHSTLG